MVEKSLILLHNIIIQIDSSLYRQQLLDRLQKQQKQQETKEAKDSKNLESNNKNDINNILFPERLKLIQKAFEQYGSDLISVVQHRKEQIGMNIYLFYNY